MYIHISIHEHIFTYTYLHVFSLYTCRWTKHFKLQQTRVSTCLSWAQTKQRASNKSLPSTPKTKWWTRPRVHGTSLAISYIYIYIYMCVCVCVYVHVCIQICVLHVHGGKGISILYTVWVSLHKCATNYLALVRRVTCTDSPPASYSLCHPVVWLVRFRRRAHDLLDTPNHVCISWLNVWRTIPLEYFFTHLRSAGRSKFADCLTALSSLRRPHNSCKYATAATTQFPAIRVLGAWVTDIWSSPAKEWKESQSE